MKKNIYSLIFILFLFPVTVLAENNVEVKSISFINKSENTVVNTEASTDGEKINLDLTFYDKDDYATYKVVVKNNNNVGLYINDSIFSSSDEHISYQFSYEDNSNFIKPDEEKTITIKVLYSTEVPKNLFRSTRYDASNNTPLVLSDKLIQIPNTLKNLGILGLLVAGFTVLCIITALVVIYKNKKVSSLNIFVILLMIVLFPKYANALFRVDIPIDSKIDIRLVKPTKCTFEGNLVQGTTYVNGQYTYHYKQKYQNYYNSTTHQNSMEWRPSDENGWGVMLTDKESTDAITSPICSTINDIPVIFFDYLYSDSKAETVDLSTIDTSNAVSINYMFSGSNFNELDVSYIDTSNLSTLLNVFERMNNINNIDISMWDTSNTTYFATLFWGASFEFINIDNIDFSNNSYDLYELARDSLNIKRISAKNTKWPKTINNTFNPGSNNNNSLESIDLTNADFSKTTKLNSVFSYNPKLKEIIGLGTVKGGKVTEMSYVFQHTESLKKIDLSQFDFSELTTSYGLFDYFGASEIITPKKMGNINLRLWYYFRDEEDNHYEYLTSETPTNTKLIANDATLNWGSSFNTQIKRYLGINSNNTSAAENTIKKIVRADSLPDDSVERIEISYYRTQNKIYFWAVGDTGYYYSDGERIYLNQDAKNMFTSFNVLTEIDYSTIDFYFTEEMNSMFSQTASIATGDVMFDFEGIELPNLLSAQNMFNGFCNNCNSVKLSLKNASNPKLTNIDYMFQSFGRNAKTVNLDITGWSIPKAEKVYYTFDSFASFSENVTVEGEGVDVSSATNTYWMFSNAIENAKKIKLNLKNWKTDSLTSMEGAFRYIDGGSESFDIDLTGWNTSKVTNMTKVFEYTGSKATSFKIKGIDKWDVSKVTNFYQMFYSAGNNSDYFELDLSRWNTSSATDMSTMFAFMGTKANEIVFGKLDNWDTSNVTEIDSMFYYTFDTYDGVVDIGTFDIYSTEADYLFNGFDGLKGVINIHNKLTSYPYIFSSVATNSGSTVTVNYSSVVDNIDDIIATKSSNSNVIKGELID